MKEPKPGDFGLSTIGGFVGFWVGLGQYIIRDGSRYTHAFIVLDDGFVMEAMPGGAIKSPLSKFHKKAVFSNIELTNEQRLAIVKEAKNLYGTPYSFLDYLALSLAHFGIRAKRLRKFIQSRGHMICSQLVDHCYEKAGVHLFDDDRLPQDVTPGDLANLLIEKDWL